MIINMSGGGSPGKIVTVHVTYGNATGSGANVVCTNGKKTFAGTADAAGDAVFKLPKGTWTITADKNGSASSMNVNVSEDCTVNISLFAATINVTYPAGSTCTATCGTTTFTAPNTSGTWACVVPNAETWTVKANGYYPATANITANGQVTTVNLKRVCLFKDGDQCVSVTGGWTGSRNYYAGQYAKSGEPTISNDIYIATSSGSQTASTVNKIDLTNYSKIEFKRTKVGGDEAAYSYASVLNSSSGNIDSIRVASNSNSPLDISGITGKYYIAVFGFHNRYDRFNNIYLVV